MGRCAIRVRSQGNERIIFLGSVSHIDLGIWREIVCIQESSHLKFTAYLFPLIEVFLGVVSLWCVKSYLFFSFS
jgi:hypothetical protein